MKLKIIYQANEVKELLDVFLRKQLEIMGFKETGSGYNFITKERDISYENPKED